MACSCSCRRGDDRTRARRAPSLLYYGLCVLCVYVGSVYSSSLCVRSRTVCFARERAVRAVRCAAAKPTRCVGIFGLLNDCLVCAARSLTTDIDGCERKEHTGAHLIVVVGVVVVNIVRIHACAYAHRECKPERCALQSTDRNISVCICCVYYVVCCVIVSCV